MKFAQAIAIAILLLPISAPAEDRLAVARQFLEENNIRSEETIPPAKDRALRDQIAASPDPETKFGPFIFALARNSDTHLTPEQARAANDLIESRRNNPVNWHDVRNIVRMQALDTLWSYVAETAPSRVTRLKADWKAWTDLRLAYMFQEFVAQERFQHAMWTLYTPEQRENILSGKWDHLIKKNTGHGRLFSADKQLLKALGPPEDEAAFNIASKKWREAWEPLLQEYQAAVRFQRQREFAMDETDEAFALATWQEYARAFRAFATAERDAIRDLLQAGYPIDAPLLEKLAAYQEVLQAQTIEKYRPHGEQFLEDLGLVK